jgi:hypothetical protein
MALVVEQQCLYGIDMDVMIPEDTPSYGEGDIVMLYTM